MTTEEWGPAEPNRKLNPAPLESMTHAAAPEPVALEPAPSATLTPAVSPEPAALSPAPAVEPRSIESEPILSEPAAAAAETPAVGPELVVSEAAPAAVKTPAVADVIGWEWTEEIGAVGVDVVPKRQFGLHNPFHNPFRNPFHKPLAQSQPDTRRGFRPKWFAIAFAVAGLASVLMVAALAVGLANSYSNRVAPGVRVGSVDVSGLTRDQVISKLQASFAYLGQGEVTVTTPVGTDKITYQDAGRKPDVEVMADAAMSIGHTGSPIGDAASIIRSAISGNSVPVVVAVDPMALANRIHTLVGASTVPPKDAKVTVNNGTFSVLPSTPGSGIDESAISGQIIGQLTRSDAPAALQAGGTFVSLAPQVSDADAQAAVAAASKMVVAVNLVWGGIPPSSNSNPGVSASPSPDPSTSPSPSVSPSPSPTPSPPPTPIPTKTFVVDAQTVRSWIVLGPRTDGAYGPAADPAQVEAYLSTLAPKVAIPPVEPWVVYDDTGTPVSLKQGKDGIGIDVSATAQAIETYLDGLTTGTSAASSIPIVMAATPPSVTLDSLSGMVLMGQGQWTTIFYPDISNAFGANIRTPAKLLNGQVVGPGQQFSFLNAVGPIDAAHGYGMGGVIEHGVSNHTGAIGGGICSASTTMFNAAMRAGLQIDERHAHFYYIYRYPVGLDATVYSNGYEVWDLKWTNDTPNPILIRASSTKGSKSTITIQLWSLPLDRTVTLSPEFKANIVPAGNIKQYVNTLAPGVQNQAEPPLMGFDTSRTRTVTDSTGKVIHTDTWNSHYTMVNGVLQIGGSPPAPPAPAPTPAPIPPAATPAPSVSGPRRRPAA